MTKIKDVKTNIDFYVDRTIDKLKFVKTTDITNLSKTNKQKVLTAIKTCSSILDLILSKN